MEPSRVTISRLAQESHHILPDATHVTLFAAQRAENARTKCRLQTHKLNIQRLNDDLQDAREDLAVANSKIDELEAGARTFDAKLERKDVKITELSAEVASLKSEVENNTTRLCFQQSISRIQIAIINKSAQWDDWERRQAFVDNFKDFERYIRSRNAPGALPSRFERIKVECGITPEVLKSFDRIRHAVNYEVHDAVTNVTKLRERIPAAFPFTNEDTGEISTVADAQAVCDVLARI